MNEPKLRQINTCDYFPEKLAEEVAAFNAEIDHLEMARLALTTEASDLRKAAATGLVEKPERFTIDAAKLIGRSAALDLTEVALIVRKNTFQDPITAARKTEHARLAGLEAARRQEIADGLKAVAVDARRCNELLNGDAKVRALALQRGDVNGYKKILTEEDGQRLTYLQSRVSAVVPIL